MFIPCSHVHQPGARASDQHHGCCRYGFENANKWTDMAVLAAMVIIYRAIAAWLMSSKR